MHIVFDAVAITGRRLRLGSLLGHCVEWIGPGWIETALGLLNRDGDKDHVEKPKDTVHEQQVHFGYRIVWHERGTYLAQQSRATAVARLATYPGRAGWQRRGDETWTLISRIQATSGSLAAAWAGLRQLGAPTKLLG